MSFLIVRGFKPFIYKKLTYSWKTTFKNWRLCLFVLPTIDFSKFLKYYMVHCRKFF